MSGHNIVHYFLLYMHSHKCIKGSKTNGAFISIWNQYPIEQNVIVSVVVVDITLDSALTGLLYVHREQILLVIW